MKFLETKELYFQKQNKKREGEALCILNFISYSVKIIIFSLIWH